MVYGDYHRGIFFDAFQRWFIWNATKAELALVQKAVKKRATRIKVLAQGKRGRPRSESDQDWLKAALETAWLHYVDGWSWTKIAKSRGTKFTKYNARTIERTLVRQTDKFAELVWDAAMQAGIWEDGMNNSEVLDGLETGFKDAKFKQWLRSKCRIPFDKFPDESRRLVLELIFRGRHQSGLDLLHFLKKTSKRVNPQMLDKK